MAELVSNALFQLIITPVGTVEEYQGVNIEDILRQPHDVHDNKIRAYSSFGFSTVFYPYNSLLHYLAARYIADIVEAGLLREDPKWEPLATKEVVELKQKVADVALDKIQQAGARGQDLVAQAPTEESFTISVDPAFLTQLYTQRDFVELSLIRNGERQIDEEYAILEQELIDAYKQEIALFVNRCQYGVGFAQMAHQRLEKELEEILKTVSEQRKSATQAIDDARHRRDKFIEEIDALQKSWFARVRAGT